MVLYNFDQFVYSSHIGDLELNYLLAVERFICYQILKFAMIYSFLVFASFPAPLCIYVQFIKLQWNWTFQAKHGQKLIYVHCESYNVTM